ncbi:GNAT family N-acetyltransferase [Roseateles oligotrophus]|uniref:GNAT family N-acetyltransferase n=1 Tax=Roseateles oligotrophus TaxID=1769250 RepID=A0ABT2YBX1_9BURK|nr:N-acetyltransferase [Roseateles oligotrophus]MCV2366860.1 GNAT family N-acetyltransferase [Roseateles oligotrophus]
MPAQTQGPLIKLLRQADLADYKKLRDGMLAAHPQAFTSDAATELKRDADSYRSRLSGGSDGANLFTLAAWDGPQMVGAISCEHEARVKVRHVAHIVGMMVSNDLHGRGVGRQLLERALALLQGEPVLELVTLSVTSSNERAVRLYERCGFQRYGRLEGAIKLPDGQLVDKDLMCRRLR